MRREEHQAALVELRRRLGLTQQQLAVALGKAVVTVARWETRRAPSARELVALGAFCRSAGQHDLADLFRVVLFRKLGIDVADDEALTGGVM